MTDQASPPAPPEEAPPPPASSQEETPPPPASAVPAAPAWRPNYAFLAIVSAVPLAADLGSKWWAKIRLDDAKTWDARHIDVVKGWFSFKFAKNLGGAWGLLQDEPESI